MTSCPETARPDGLSQAEWEAVLEMRKRYAFDSGRNAGLEEAAQLADSWGEQSGGGSGHGGTGYLNLASAIRRLCK